MLLTEPKAQREKKIKKENERKIIIPVKYQTNNKIDTNYKFK